MIPVDPLLAGMPVPKTGGDGGGRADPREATASQGEAFLDVLGGVAVARPDIPAPGSGEVPSPAPTGEPDPAASAPVAADTTALSDEEGVPPATGDVVSRAGAAPAPWPLDPATAPPWWRETAPGEEPVSMLPAARAASPGPGTTAAPRASAGSTPAIAEPVAAPGTGPEVDDAGVALEAEPRGPAGNALPSAAREVRHDRLPSPHPVAQPASPASGDPFQDLGGAAPDDAAAGARDGFRADPARPLPSPVSQAPRRMLDDTTTPERRASAGRAAVLPQSGVQETHPGPDRDGLPASRGDAGPVDPRATGRRAPAPQPARPLDGVTSAQVPSPSEGGEAAAEQPRVQRFDTDLRHGAELEGAPDTVRGGAGATRSHPAVTPAGPPAFSSGTDDGVPGSPQEPDEVPPGEATVEPSLEKAARPDVPSHAARLRLADLDVVRGVLEPARPGGDGVILPEGRGESLTGWTAGAVEAADAMSPAPGSPPSTRATAADAPRVLSSTGWTAQIAEQTITAMRLGRRQAELVLDPPELGPVRLHLTVHHQAVHARFEVEHPAVRAVLQSELAQLAEAIAGQGLEAGSFEVQLLGERSARERQGRGRRDTDTEGNRAEWKPPAPTAPSRGRRDPGAALDYWT